MPDRADLTKGTYDFAVPLVRVSRSRTPALDCTRECLLGRALAFGDYFCRKA